MLQDTEWNHVLKQKGIVSGPIQNEVEMTEEQIHEIVDKVMEDREAAKTMQELEEMEDDLEFLEDNRILE